MMPDTSPERREGNSRVEDMRIGGTQQQTSRERPYSMTQGSSPRNVGCPHSPRGRLTIPPPPTPAPHLPLPNLRPWSRYCAAEPGSEGLGTDGDSARGSALGSRQSASPPRRPLRLRPRRLLLLLPGLLLPLCGAFNLDVDSPAEYSGPEGSYFGFAVDFFVPSASSRMFLLVGAPKANTTQPGIVEGGQVLKCDWSSSRRCQPIEFDATGNRDYAKDDPLEFKSHQWFGASVRSKQDKILACAPLYHWRTEMKQEREPVGTCFLQDGTKTVEYAPCRSKNIDADGQGFCQGGFSIDFTKADRVLLGGPGSFYWQGQLISDQVAEIVSKYDPNVYSIKYNNQLATRTAQAIFDDSYLGYSVAVGDFNGDGIDDFVSGVPRAARTLGMVYIYDGKNMSSLHNFTGEQMAAYFGFSVAATDINGDDYADVFIGAPLFMDRGSDGKLQEVGQVSVSLQRASGDFQTTKLNGYEVFARFGSAIAPLGDLDQDGFNDIAIAAPYGGEDKKGIVYIFNGRSTGLNAVPSQILEGQWAARSMPPSFGYSMKGATDIDKNGYPVLVKPSLHSRHCSHH
ncbi:PREDICTED: integrin alpha-V-like [Galeopterus variegatus]|uniref:Integrin alpha-V-like n=1 Tax=Galeopterus variegatus TaxID=482537 RepID=A0ABM0S9N8_GALVR|nr:PREDICTED: integrin alpha-V-like [Galeopterus variegatus]